MSQQRIPLYGTAFVVICALAWVGFIRKEYPSPEMLLDTSKFQLKLVAGQPSTLNGKPNELRQTILTKVDADLELAERLVRESPSEYADDFNDGLASILDFRAYGRLLAGDRQQALDYYGQIIALAQVDRQRRCRVFHTMAKVYLDMGRSESSLQILGQLEKQIPDLTGVPLAKIALLRAQALHQQGAPVAEVASSLERAGNSAESDVPIQTRVADLYEKLGLGENACIAYERAAVNQPKSLFPLALLKFRTGDVEGALNALVELGKKAPEYLRVCLGEEKELMGLATEPRLQAVMTKADK